MKELLFTLEAAAAANLFPFILTRTVLDFRVGITTIREKWSALLPLPLCNDQNPDKTKILLRINTAILPEREVAAAINALLPGERLTGKEGEIICECLKGADWQNDRFETVSFSGPIRKIEFPWHIFELNGWAIAQDFDSITANRSSGPVSGTNRLTNPAQIFIEEGATVEHCIINAAQGPVYIAKGAEVMEGSMLRGPVAIGEKALVKMGSKIYGATTVGPSCVVGGEIKNCVFFGYSNKAHDGYLGDSVIGEWCNMGAGTSNSNIKNTATAVKVHLPHRIFEVGLKCGVLMGDYTRTAINTSINTGTVTGVCCNIFEPGLTPKAIPSFSWGTAQVYRLEKAIADIDAWKRLKGVAITDREKRVLKSIFEQSYPPQLLA
jgi:UDP-N-acetylglucosamine diphosphorylase/glucosamine-1-phosphate N-acetyltransferase